MDTTAVEVVVTGRVQGVAFRAYCQQEATRCGVTGWVRNQPDGSVAAHFEGPATAVERMVGWCREGPSYAVVTGVDVRPTQPTGAARFEVAF
jgi:acylphosphatase